MAVVAQGLRCMVNPLTGATSNPAYLYGSSYRDSFKVAMGNINSTSTPEFLSLATNPPHQFSLRLFTGTGTQPSMLAQVTVTGVQQVAMGDVVGGDGIDELLIGSARGVDVFSGGGRFELFIPFPGGLGGLATGDFNGDGVDEVLVGGLGNDRVQVYSTLGGTGTLVGQGNAFGGMAMTGVFVAAGDLNGDGRDDVIAAPGAGAAPTVRVFSIAGGPALIAQFAAFETTFTGGVRVASVDANNDGDAEIMAGSGPGKSAELRLWEAYQDAIGVRIASWWDPQYSNPFSAGYTLGLDLAAVALVTP
jgi:hypothetical protein